MEIYEIMSGGHLCAMTVSKERAETLRNFYGGRIEDLGSRGGRGGSEIKEHNNQEQGTAKGKIIIYVLLSITISMFILLIYASCYQAGYQLAKSSNENVTVTNPAGGPIVQTMPKYVQIPLAVPSAEPVNVTAESVATEQEAQVMPWAKSMECKVTFYDCCVKCCGKTNGITASGEKAVPHHTCAVDPKTIPLGTDVFIDYGDGELHKYRANDTGSGIKGTRIDVCVGSHAEALKIGARQATVYWNERVF